MSGNMYRGPIKILVLDVDGVLTDGSLYLTDNGEFLKVFNARDGVAVALLRAHGIATGIISGKSSRALDHRIEQLGIEYSVTGVNDKRSALDEILCAAGTDASSAAYVGDDVIDLPLAGHVQLFFAVSDAHPLVLQGADHVLKTSGGRGAVREAAEQILLGGGLSLTAAYEPLICQQRMRTIVQ
ncbi:phenylphosphate carboxylase subunit delta [Mycolicibacterium austroafricanum]|uniref:Phenylphosphate carboxylase subunit delta n=1 Tax=Mycolicibacterium austroafricanum TaxID=39687 RepID=A0ABT8HHU1_MYCAO|nr:phenylphosphate carboxylase subunit delta [Mycolicibacterium austroafricanum]MDN4520332.1 phenylphosphate carboxylase subunit delta [Mycolicibacterium austroafricanum]